MLYQTLVETMNGLRMCEGRTSKVAMAMSFVSNVGPLNFVVRFSETVDSRRQVASVSFFNFDASAQARSILSMSKFRLSAMSPQSSDSELVAEFGVPGESITVPAREAKLSNGING